MRELSECPQDEVAYTSHGRYRGAIYDRRTKQRLEFSGDDPFVVFTLDDDSVEWDGKRPDGVLIANIDGTTWVCFVEMKGRADAERAFKQLESGARHFCPVRRTDGGDQTHGDDHHDAWRGGDDEIDVMPESSHRTLGLFVTFRAPERRPPRPPVVIAGRPLLTQVVYLSKRKPHWAHISPRELLKRAGVV